MAKIGLWILKRRQALDMKGVYLGIFGLGIFVFGNCFFYVLVLAFLNRYLALTS